MDIRLPLVPVQQGMFFHYIHNRNKDYLEQMICDIAGTVDVELFEKTLNKLVEWHDSLRTLYRYEKETGMEQVILPRKTVKLDYRDVSDMADPRQYVEQCISLEADKNLDLARETCRSNLFKTGANQFVYLCTYHHLIMDSWAIRLFHENFCKIYHAEQNGLPYDDNQRYSYKLFVDWVARQDSEKTKRYWAEKLTPYAKAQLPAPISYSTVFHRNTERVGFDPATVKLIDRISRDSHVTPNSVVLAAWGIYLLDHFHKEEILFGCVTLGRIIGLKDVDKIAGLFVNSIPLHVQKTLSARAYIAGIQKDVYMASAHAYLSLSDIMAAAGLRPTDICTFLNFSIDEEELDNAYSARLPFAVKRIRYNEQSNYDVYLDVYLTENGLRMNIYYDRDKYYFNGKTVAEKMAQILLLLHEQPDIPVKNIVSSLVAHSTLTDDADFNF